MMEKRAKAYYPYEPIYSIESLAKCLSICPQKLVKTAESASKYYRPGKKICKSNKVRRTVKTISILNYIQKQINNKILKKVQYPIYIQGSVKCRDYMSNAALHIGARIIINEDIDNFFPSCVPSLIYNVWRYFFNFSETVADCLTKLTTFNGALPQGTATSPYLANLIFWRKEAGLYLELQERNLIYSRFVDDITISAKHRIDKGQIAELVSKIYSFLFQYELQPKRKKHRIYTSKDVMLVNNMLVGRKHVAARQVKDLNNCFKITKKIPLIRAGVYELEWLADKAESINLQPKVGSLLGRINQIKRAGVISKKAQPKALLKLEERLITFGKGGN